LKKNITFHAYFKQSPTNFYMKKLLFLVTLVAFSACYNSNKNKDKTDVAIEKEIPPSVSALLEDYYKERMKLFPLEATTNGVNEYNDLLPIDISATFREEIRLFYEKYKENLSKIDKSTLNDNDKMSVDILSWDMDRGLDGLKSPNYMIPFSQFEGMHLTLGQLGSGEGAQPFKTTKDYDNWLKRIAQFPVWADTAIANMRLGMQKGWVLPKSLAVKILPQLKPLAEDPTEKNLFYGPVSKLKSNKNISDEDKKRITADYTKMVNNIVKPSYKKLYDFIGTEYMPKTRTSSGISAIPEGDAYYRSLVKYWTTSDMTPEEIFALGEKEVARIRSEMEKVKEAVGFKGDLKAFFKQVNDNEPKLRPFKDPKEVLANFHAIHDKMKPQLAKQFDLVPKTPFEIRRTEAFREASASAEYMQGNLKDGRAGVFYTPIPNIAKYNLYQDESLFLHEAIPGHHYQIALQQENADLPDFRKNNWYGAYGEGWALYTEGLGKELGLYTDPYQYFGRLGGEMHRAIRLVVDVGLHTKGWTREQAIKYDLDNEADTEEAITAEIERYMAIPGQALSYKVGEQRILGLKMKAVEALGNKFDIKAFHNEVLKDGCVPLAILEKKIDNFIEKYK
jgi:uncharacterized protein (DUF885 family)